MTDSTRFKDCSICKNHNMYAQDMCCFCLDLQICDHSIPIKKETSRNYSDQWKSKRSNDHASPKTPLPRAIPVRCCRPVIESKTVTEKFKDGRVKFRIEEEYLAEFCTSKKDCVDFIYPEDSYREKASLPKYLRVGDKENTCVSQETYYPPPGIKYFR
uniref:Cysteine-rich DPF motif domain-containing protein 1 n=1 Tax=Mesocestoides corti TaxID=53468 RepID=A0A5K3FKW9_MESCO